jgi:hypothetical protein
MRSVEDARRVLCVLVGQSLGLLEDAYAIATGVDEVCGAALSGRVDGVRRGG